ncbi:MAG: ParA family protein [Planctomycetota bacterium]
MIYAVINQKGGAGKTTLAVHLALRLHDAGRSVAFIDNDPQQSATRWIAAAEPEMRLESLTTAEDLVAQAEALAEEYDDVVCDGSPRLNDQTHVLMYLADKVLIPVLPSALDVHATLETKDAIDRVTEARAADGMEPPAVLIALNKVRTTGEQAKIVRQALAELGLPVAKTSVGLRDAFIKAVVDDTSVHRDGTKSRGHKQASADLDALFHELLQLPAEPALALAA